MGTSTMHLALGYRSWCTLKRRWISTLIFICAPIFLSAMFVLFKINMGSSETKTTYEAPVIPHSLKKEVILGLSIVNVIAAYPNNENVRKLMNQVSAALPSVAENGGVTYCNSTEELGEFLFNSSQTGSYGSYGYGVNFEELSQTALTYSLRCSNSDWYTNQGFPSVMLPGPMESGLFYSLQGFLPLQVAINEAYAKITLGKPFGEWELQQFPYPAYKREEKYTLQFQLMEIICSFSISFMLTKFAIMMVEEKTSGMKELLKINGVSSFLNYSSWLIFYGIICAFIALTITIMWSIPLQSGTVLPHTNPILFFFILLIFFVASMCSVTLLCTFLQQPKYAALLVVAYWVGSNILVNQLLANFRTLPILICLALLPYGGNAGVFGALAEFEAAGSGATFSNLFTSPPVPTRILPIGVNLALMLCSIFIYLPLALYVDAIHPGKYGRARPWNFFFSRHCTRVKAERHSLLNDENNSPLSAQVEVVRNNTPVGLKMENVVKVFGALKAVDNLSLTVYKNQITALLGHNGAGKSTLFSIISGMYSPTSGQVSTAAYDIFEGNNIEMFRRTIGFCPQHDLLMDTLTVQQHLIIFSMMKGMTFAEATVESEHWMNHFKIFDSRNKLISALSGGMKRKLCLSLALVGRPELLLLDEPTSGLDPESRRDIWDVLLSIRGNRTIIISTHFMEEADILGDKIAIVAHGRLRCYGSKLFLKNLYGSGYQLNYTYEGDDSEVRKLISGIIKDPVINKKSDTVMTVQLPSSTVEQFPKLFRAFKQQFGTTIEYTLSCPTMDDVFLRIQEDEGIQMSVDEVDMPTMIQEINQHRSSLSPVRKEWDHLKALLFKRYVWAIHNWKSLILFAVVIPLVAAYLTISGGKTAQETEIVSNLSLTLDTYPDSLALIAKKSTSDPIASSFESAVRSSGSSYVDIQSSENITSALLQRATDDLLFYRSKMIVSLDSRTTPTALYSTLAYHSSPIAVNMLANALLSQNNLSSHITTYNFPYHFNKETCSLGGFSASAVTAIVLWVAIYGAAMITLGSFFIIVPHTERRTGVKHLQYMSGVQPITFWLSNLIMDSIIFLVPIIITLVMVTALDHDVYSNCLTLCTLVLVITLFGIGSICFAYLNSFLFKTYTSAMELYIFFSIFAAIGSAIASQYTVSNWVPYILYLIPWVSFTSALTKIIQFAFQVSTCSTCKIEALRQMCEAQVAKLDMSSMNIQQELIYLGLTPILFFVIICAIDYGLLRMIGNKLKKILYGSIEKVSNDSLTDLDVADEKQLVGDSRRNPVTDFDDGRKPIFVCDDLAKKYSRSFTAVYDLTFAIRKGECFGLLGVNGAGKSTAFGMLTGSLIPTTGDARLMNFTLSQKRHEYLVRLGYCPQLDGLLLELSARSLLSIFGQLRHIPPSELEAITQKWIDALDMGDICDKPCQVYSGGNKRKLSTAIALIGNPPVVLLDEPTTGVDPVIRRKIWSILKYCREENHQTIIVTSHSMDECEALCDRLTIMVKGSMTCIGTVPHLKNRYGHGYILLVKLSSQVSEVEMNSTQSLLLEKFKPNIAVQEVQHGLMTFRIDSKEVELYTIFEIMNSLKAQIEYLEEFSVSAVSLENVFLSLAKNK